jgi:hypothetical protein
MMYATDAVCILQGRNKTEERNVTYLLFVKMRYAEEPYFDEVSLRKLFTIPRVSFR